MITVCEAIRKPIFSEVQIVGFDSFSPLVDRIGEDILSDFNTKGYVASMIGYVAMTTPEGKVVYCEDTKKENSEAHENFHVLMKEAKLRTKDFVDPARAYLSMLCESAATAVQLLPRPENEQSPLCSWSA